MPARGTTFLRGGIAVVYAALLIVFFCGLHGLTACRRADRR